MKSLITFLALIIIPFLIKAQSSDHPKLDSFFTILEEENRFFGSVAVSKGGQMVYENSIGFADLERVLKINKDTKFRIGSISKTFTATLIMKGIELGLLGLDDPIDEYFPRIQNAHKISVRHLLNHKSGISNFTDRNYLSWHKNAITPAALLDTIVNKGVDFEPNTDYAYSNSNYVLLTFILEKVFSTSYDKILDKYIVKVIDLENTAYGKAINTEENEAKSYRMKSDWVEASQDHMSIPLGAGGIVSTPHDLCRFIAALFKGALISKASLGQMMPDEGDSYGFALYETPFSEHRGRGHGGNIDAFASNVTYFEEGDLSFAISCSGANFGMHEVEMAVLSEFFDEEYDLPSFEIVELQSEELDQYLGTYVSAELPMDMIISKQDKTLYLKATGQTASELSAKGNNKFEISKYGVKMEFVPSEGRLIFEQNGMRFELQRSNSLNEEENTGSTNVNLEAKSDLGQYVGVYESSELPIDLEIRISDGNLVGQGEGQAAFMLSSGGGHTFSNEEIGLTITFIPEMDKMSFEQGSAQFEMFKKVARN